MTHLHDTLGTFANHGKRLRQNVVQAFALCNSRTELIRLGAQLLIAECFVLGLKAIDQCHSFAVLFDQAVVATAENFGQKIDRHGDTGLTLRCTQGPARKSCLKVDSKVPAHKAQVNAPF